MNKSFAILAITLSSLTVFAQEPSTNKVPMPMRKWGGMVTEQAPAGSKSIVLVDARSSKTQSLVKAFNSHIYTLSQLDVKTVNGDATYRNDNEDIVVILVDNGETTINPATKTAIVAQAQDDKATVRKLSSAAVCLVGLACDSINDLQTMMVLNEGSAKLNIPQLRRARYIDAVRQGWAPPPTNEYQKAVLDRVMAEKATNAPSATPPAK